MTIFICAAIGIYALLDGTLSRKPSFFKSLFGATLLVIAFLLEYHP